MALLFFDGTGGHLPRPAHAGGSQMAPNQHTFPGVTDLLLFFLTRALAHKSLVNANDGKGPMYWYWSLVALVVAVIMISTSACWRVTTSAKKSSIGRDRDSWMMRVPLLNKTYGAIKQVNDAFAGKRHSFKTVVLVEFPREGMRSIGFLAHEQRDEVPRRTREKVVCIFVTATASTHSGFLVLVPEDKVTRCDM